MRIDRLKVTAMLSALLLLTACAAKTPPTPYLNVADLKGNLQKRVANIFSESEEQAPEIEIRRTAPALVRIGDDSFYLFAVNFTLIHPDKKRPPREMTLLVDPAGKLEFSELNHIASGKNPAQEALDIASRKHIGPNLGDLLLKGKGSNDVLLVSDPFCPYCRLSYTYLKGKKDKINELRILELPYSSHPGARMSVMGIFKAADSPNVSFLQAVDFAYQELNSPDKKNRDKADQFVLEQFSAAFPEPFSALPGGQGGYAHLEGLYGEKVDKQIQAADKLGVSATPTIFINGVPVRGFSREDIDRLLK